MVEEITKNFEKAMKKGFISALILLILEKNPSYGYKISKDITNRTLGIWTPPASTMYTVLKEMTKNGLIKYIEQKEEGRTRKIYEVTKKGEEILKLMLEKQQIINESIETLMAATIGSDKELSGHFFPRHGPFNFFFEKLEEKSEEEKLKLLEFHKLKLSQKIERLKEQYQKIEEVISQLKNKAFDKNPEEEQKVV